MRGHLVITYWPKRRLHLYLLRKPWFGRYLVSHRLPDGFHAVRLNKFGRAVLDEHWSAKR